MTRVEPSRFLKLNWIYAILFLFPFCSAVYATKTFKEFSGFPYWYHEFQIDEKMVEEETSHQHLMIFKNALFGQVLALDRTVQLTESDEFSYHEMIVHVPMLSHENPQSILIIGGGDGGTLREVLRHSTVLRVTLVEITPEVIEFSKKHFPQLSNGAFDDPRVQLVHQDGAKYLSDTSEKYDVIICDSSDPDGPAGALFTHKFYGLCKSALNEKGIVVNYNPLPSLDEHVFLQFFHNRSIHFQDARIYCFSQPSFKASFIRAGVSFGFSSCCSDYKQISKKLLRSRLKRVKGNMQFYNPEVHKASFAIPQYLVKLCQY